jgi:hypothetical protein
MLVHRDETPCARVNGSDSGALLATQVPPTANISIPWAPPNGSMPCDLVDVYDAKANMWRACTGANRVLIAVY